MLTEEQSAAVYSPLSENAVVNAGAGSGKTTLLAARALHLINSGVPPSSIMMVTFTRKAARELSERLGEYAPLMLIGTFHSLCIECMRRMDICKNVIDEQQQGDLVDACAISLGMATRNDDGSVKYIKKSRGHWIKHIDAVRGGDAEGVSPIVDTYLTRLAIAGDIDYTGILHEGLRYAPQAFKDVTHVILDEAQDTSRLQMRVVSAIGAKVMAVGDVAQSIFRWAGADPELFEALPWKRYALTETFRNPSNVVAIANKLPMKRVELRTQRGYSRHAVVEGDDVEGVVRWLVSEGMELDDIAVLCRYNNQAEHYAEILAGAGWGIKRKVMPPAGAIYRALLFLASPWSETARMSAAKEWRHHQCGKPMSWVLSEMSTSSVSALIENWMRKTDGTVGGVLDALGIPNSLTLEAWWYRQHSALPLSRWVAEESRIEPITKSHVPGITVGTVHSSKGGEWLAVILPALDAWNHRGREDDWRLFYVGITRVKETLCLMHTGEWFGQEYC